MDQKNIVERQGAQIVQILRSQGIVWLRNDTNWELVLNTYNEKFRKAVFFAKKGQKQYYTGEFVLFSMILNHTIPGITNWNHY